MKKDLQWRLNRLLYPVYNLGPGRRLAIWTQGCSLQCQGCLSQSLWDSSGGRDINVDSLLQKIVPLADHFDGVTISGGEPFDQYEPLLYFCQEIKRVTAMDIYLFSGYSLQELDQRFTGKEFRECVDYLVEGRYRKELSIGDSWRGSSNQQLYKLCPDHEIVLSPGAVDQPWSVAVSQEGALFLSGIPAPGDLGTIVSDFNEKGVRLAFQ